MQRLRDEVGGERQEHHHQQEQVDPEQERIGSLELIGHRRVGEPRRPDRQETDEVREVGRSTEEHPIQRWLRDPPTQREVQHDVIANPSTPSLNPSIRVLLS